MSPPTLGTVIDQRRIQALPLNRRDFLQLSLLVARRATRRSRARSSPSRGSVSRCTPTAAGRSTTTSSSTASTTTTRT
ncbi:MAG: hypothetical protein MZW92_53370 [Comamonadaceae bacterium]|nr:hypothetical protein [Comamonadaceae bacterium]